MPNMKLTDVGIPLLAAPSADDIIYIVDDPGGATPLSKKVTIANLFLNVPTNGLEVGSTQLVVLGDKVGIGLAAPAAKLDVGQIDNAGAIPCLELDQDDVDDVFINFVGTTAADQTKSISTVNGDGVVTGPKNFAAAAGWEYIGMVKVEVNGAPFWMPYYQPDTA